MTHRSAVRFAVACFALYALAVHWPGMLPFSGTRPFVLGLPFNFFWIVLWVVLGGIALGAVELTRDAAGNGGSEPVRQGREHAAEHPDTERQQARERTAGPGDSARRQPREEG